MEVSPAVGTPSTPQCRLPRALGRCSCHVHNRDAPSHKCFGLADVQGRYTEQQFSRGRHQPMACVQRAVAPTQELGPVHGDTAPSEASVGAAYFDEGAIWRGRAGGSNMPTHSLSVGFEAASLRNGHEVSVVAWWHAPCVNLKSGSSTRANQAGASLSNGGRGIGHWQHTTGRGLQHARHCERACGGVARCRHQHERHCEKKAG